MLMTAACLDEPDCFHLNNDLVGISFKKLADSRADTVYILRTGTAEPALVFYADTIVSRLTFPLNYFENETTFLFEDSTQTVRRLRVGYTSQAQFVSENCGEKFVLTDLRVLEHSFDSVRLLRDAPSSEFGAMHIEIYQ
jgi:hypothetical protein